MTSPESWWMVLMAGLESWWQVLMCWVSPGPLGVAAITLLQEGHGGSIGYTEVEWWNGHHGLVHWTVSVSATPVHNSGVKLCFLNNQVVDL